jgi:hypothetical protein
MWMAVLKFWGSCLRSIAPKRLSSISNLVRSKRFVLVTLCYVNRTHRFTL